MSDIYDSDWKLADYWRQHGYDEKAMRELPRGIPCGPGCLNHVTHPCERCGRYAAGLFYAADASRPVEVTVHEHPSGPNAVLVSNATLYSNSVKLVADNVDVQDDGTIVMSGVVIDTEEVDDESEG